MKTYSVFISYSQKDASLARRIADQIKGTGASVFLDALSLKPQQPFAAKIEDAMRESDEVVAVVTSNSGSSPQLGFELGVAAALGKKVTPVLSNVSSKDLPSAISSFRGVKSEDLRGYLSELAARVKSR